MKTLTLLSVALVAFANGCAAPPAEPTPEPEPSVQLAAVEGKQYGIAIDANTEAPGLRCPMGGVRVHFGKDLNEDGALQEAEIEGTSFTCSTECGNYQCGGSCGECGEDEACTAGKCVIRSGTPRSEAP